MKHPSNIPDSLCALGKSNLLRLLKLSKTLNSKSVTNNSQIMITVNTTILRIDFCKEKHIIKGQNKLNRVVITRDN